MFIIKCWGRGWTNEAIKIDRDAVLSLHHNSEIKELQNYGQRDTEGPLLGLPHLASLPETWQPQPHHNSMSLGLTIKKPKLERDIEKA